MTTSVRSRIQLNTRLLPVFFLLAFLMQIVDPYKGWVILSVGLGLIWLLSYLWSRSLSKSLRFVREMRFGWAQVGDRLEERFTLYNNGILPAIWVEVLDHSNLPGYNPGQVRGVESSGRNSWHTRGLCTRRGIFTLGPTSLRTGDPFGVYTVTIEDPASTTLMVMPPIVPLPSIEVSPGGRAGEGRPRSNAPERTVVSAMTREYVPGDSLHTIHWRTTARRGSPYVRIFEGIPAGDWWILLDLDKEAQAGEGWDSTTEHAVILAASLADRGMRMGRSVGMVANGDPLVWLPPQAGNQNETRRWEILRSLALINPADTSLASLLQRTRPSIARQSSLIIITANTGTAWIEALIPLLWRGVIPTVLLLDPTTFVPAEAAGQVASPDRALAALADLGVSRYQIPRQLLDRPEARPGQEGQWEWRVSPRGRAVAVRKPANMSWKVLR